MKLLLSLALVACIAQPISILAAPPRNLMERFDDDPVAAPSPTPDDELERAKRETALAEEKQKKAEAEQAELEARRAKLKAATDPLGDTSKVAVPGGDVKTDQAGFVEVRMLSLEAARTISNQLVSALCGQAGVQTLVIYDQNELKAIVFSRTMVTQLQALSSELKIKTGDAENALAVTNPKKTKEMKTVGGNKLLSLNLGTGFLESISPATALPGVAAGVISSIAQVANLFRSDTEFKNKDVTIPEDMVVSYIVNGINTNGCSTKPNVYYPHLYPADLFADNADSPLLKAVNDIRTDKQNTAAKLKEIDTRIKAINEIAKAIDDRDGSIAQRDKLRAELKEVSKLDPHCKKTTCTKLSDEIATLEGDIENANKGIKEATNNGEDRFTGQYKAWLKQLKTIASETQPLVDAAGEIISKLDNTDAASNTTALAQLLEAEKLALVLNSKSTFMLRVAVSANGTTKIKKNMFVDAKVRHTAGADLVYQLFDRDGHVVMGDAMQFYYEYKSAGQVREEVAKGNPPAVTGAGEQTHVAITKAITPKSH